MGAVNVSFDLNIAQLFSPLLLIVVAWLVKLARDKIMDNMNAKHAENTERLGRIETQTTATNGKVAEQELRLTKQEAKTELLTEMLLGRQPDKGS